MTPAAAEPSADARLEKVRHELARYEHPLFFWNAHISGEIVEVEIRCRMEGFHTYILQLRPREIDQAQFPWNFQKQLYDSLHDYVIEMLTSNPQLQD